MADDLCYEHTGESIISGTFQHFAFVRIWPISISHIPKNMNDYV